MSTETLTATKKKYTPKQILNICVTLFLMFGFGYVVPPFAGITDVGMRVLGVFLGVLYGYSTSEIAWPSLFAFIAYGLTGYTTVKAGISQIMGQDIVFQSIVAFLCAGAITYYGFGKWFVRWSLTRRIFKGKPSFYIWCFYVVFGCACVVINQTQLMILLFAIWMDIAETCGYKDDKKFVYSGMTGIILATMLGGGMIPYTSWRLGLAQSWGEVVGADLNMGLMLAVTLPVTLLGCTLYVLAMVKVFKVDLSKMKAFDVEKLGDESKVLRPRAKRIIIIYLITIIIVVLGNTLPSGMWLRTFVNKTVTIPGMYGICAALLMIFPSGEGDGKPCLVFKEVHRKAINWNSIFMCGVCVTLASALTDAELGISAAMTSIFEPIFAGKGGLFIMIFTLVVSIVLTNFGSNIAFGTALIPIIGPFVVESGANPQLVGAALIYLINIGMVLPAASSPAAIFHSHEALPDAGERTRYTLFACVLALVTAIVVFSVFYIFIG